jgi:hypothetical protein
LTLRGNINLDFGYKIPESFLTYPKSTLLEAFEVINRDSYKNGNKKMMSLMHERTDDLLSFIDDDEAFIIAAERFNNPMWRNAIISSLKELQKTCITIATSQY